MTNEDTTVPLDNNSDISASLPTIRGGRTVSTNQPVLRESTEAALRVVDLETGEPLDDAYADHLHQLGLECQEAVEFGKVAEIKLGVVFDKAREPILERGGARAWGAWLRHYAPGVSRKTADRLANTVRSFTGGSPDKLSALEALLSNLRLCALYKLAAAAVPPQAREAALEEARAGRVVTLGVADEIIRKHTVPCLPSPNSTRQVGAAPRLQRREITVEGGQVIVKSSGDEMLKVLKAAIKQVERLGS